MNWKELFKSQLKLDYEIKKRKQLHNEQLTDKKILALLGELGELLNEWRAFKFWKENPQPTARETEPCKRCNASGKVRNHQKQNAYACSTCKGNGYLVIKDPLLEEYVDCLHFLLSIGNDIGFTNYSLIQANISHSDIIKTFLFMFDRVSIIGRAITIDSKIVRSHYSELLSEFMVLGELLGFTETEIKKAYYVKNQVNHQRQSNGY